MPTLVPLIRLLKVLRVSQPFNWIATALVRRALAMAGVAPPEAIVRHLHRAGRVESVLPNGRTLVLWSRGDDWVSNQIYWRGWQAYETETAPLFFELASKASVTVDVGAYVGYYALLAAHANPAGRVIALEPHPGVFPRLARNVALNNLTNLEALECAAGEKPGVAELFHSSSPMPTSSGLARSFFGTETVMTSTSVRVEAPSALLAERGFDRVDLMKIDTEGTEPQVLLGMGSLLRDCRPDMVCEVLPGRGTEGPLTEILRPLGYRFLLLTPDGPSARREVVGHPQFLNYLFTAR
jgi:FkbM family methyltransferase